MITNGEKYACESCIRGHRVAQCQHTGKFIIYGSSRRAWLMLTRADRPLQRVGKKGRPVSQCNHCRTLRTSRSVHTNCKCGSTSRQATLKQFGQGMYPCFIHPRPRLIRFSQSDASAVRAATARAPTRLVRRSTAGHLHLHLQPSPIREVPGSPSALLYQTQRPAWRYLTIFPTATAHIPH